VCVRVGDVNTRSLFVDLIHFQTAVIIEYGRVVNDNGIKSGWVIRIASARDRELPSKGKREIRGGDRWRTTALLLNG
jgi:hypothetical protein